MLSPSRASMAIALLLLAAAGLRAEVLVRWDRAAIPSPDSLGISTVVVPAKNETAVRDALGRGYRVFLEVEAARLGTLVLPRGNVAGVLVSGKPGAASVRALEQRIGARGVTVHVLDARASWPHIRSNWVTRNNNQVLQVTGRSAQPWIESNAALLRIIRASRRMAREPITYAWKPITLSEIDEGPQLENYLIAIAEAGSFGADLVLPLHPRFEAQLSLGYPEARAAWTEIRRAIEFYSWELPARYEPIANIGVVAREPMLSFEIMNLLARHNLPFALLDPAQLKGRSLSAFDLLIAVEETTTEEIPTLAAFAQKGGTVVLVHPAGSLPWRSTEPENKSQTRATYRHGTGRIVEVLAPVSDPNAFALEMRQVLGADKRIVDIWNGITVLTAPYRAPNKDDGEASGGPGTQADTVLLTVLNYAAQPLPIQLRVRGTFSQVHYESPGEPLTRLPYEHRDGFTELVLPALRIGGRVFLTRAPELNREPPSPRAPEPGTSRAPEPANAETR